MSLVLSGSGNVSNSANGVISLPVGCVLMFANNSVPSGWLKCNGQDVSRTTYAALFAAIGTTYGEGNGLTTFSLPNACGEFLRGLDDGRGVDSGRVIGSWQEQEVQSHSHTLTVANMSNLVSGTYAATAPGTTHAQATSSTGGDETRPRNIAFLVCIKY
jgi:microcystin-dependent protein